MTPPPKKAGLRRIIAVGDSLTWGLGVRLNEAWPAQLDVGMLELVIQY